MGEVGLVDEIRALTVIPDRLVERRAYGSARSVVPTGGLCGGTTSRERR
jgi:predicted ATP-dependent serine protease